MLVCQFGSCCIHTSLALAYSISVRITTTKAKEWKSKMPKKDSACRVRRAWLDWKKKTHSFFHVCVCKLYTCPCVCLNLFRGFLSYIHHSKRQTARDRTFFRLCVKGLTFLPEGEKSLKQVSSGLVTLNSCTSVEVWENEMHSDLLLLQLFLQYSNYDLSWLLHFLVDR